MLHVHLRDTRPVHSKVNVANANNPGGLMIFEKGQLFQYTDRETTFLISAVEKIRQPIAGHIWHVDILQEGSLHNMRLSMLRTWLEVGKIKLVK